MDAQLSHSDIQELLGAYALDAVDGEEAQAVETHLRGCPRCRSEVLGYREVAAGMAYAGTPAPVGLWDRIAASLEEPPPAPTLATVSPLRPRAEPVSARRGAGLRVAAAVAVAAALVIGVLGVKVVDTGRRLDAIATASQREQLARVANLALVDPQARRVALRSPDRSVAGEAEAVMLPDGTGFLVKGNLPRLPKDRVYQLWALVGTSKISAGILGSELSASSPVPFKADAAVWGLAVTSERGPVTTTSNAPILLGRLQDTPDPAGGPEPTPVTGAKGDGPSRT